MINYVSYFLFFFGNFLFIFFIDNDLAYDFLSVYSISGLIIGPFIFFYFSKLRESIKFSKILIILLNLSLFFISDFLIFLIILYSINVFYCDFLSSQSNNYKINFYFKLSFFLSVIPFILNIFDINQLLIPDWLKDGINDKIETIIEYQSIIDDELINYLPFCP